MSQSFCIVGLGYVGLQLAINFGKKFITYGYDTSYNKVNRLKNFNDQTNEISHLDFIEAKHLSFTNDSSIINKSDIVIVAVPTPIDINNIPDLSLLKEASENIGRNLKKGSIVVYESTVYPGATEEICIPIIEKFSSMKWKKDFNIGYSPERINPGDKLRKLSDIIKVVVGDTEETTKILSKAYGSIVKAGVFEAKSIIIAETAKVIENTQRDLNIALMNELAIICNNLGIDTNDVIDTASTKWNFMPFKPGLVGGHCIGVDPYYLTYKAQLLGYKPDVILAGRKMNDNMSDYIANRINDFVNNSELKLNKIIHIMGITFKENCNDIRNSKVYDLYRSLINLGFTVNVHDPIANKSEAKELYDIDLVEWDDLPLNAGILVSAVMHDYYKKLPLTEILSKMVKGGILFDIKSIHDAKEIEKCGKRVWRL